MNLLLPLGLLGLIGIPVILLVHIIKPKYHERTISSTYIWHLARKYRKRKIPFEKLTQFLLIAIQFFIVAAISILLTQPFVTSPEKIVNDQIILLDCSASMNTVTKNGETRYKKAVDEIVNSFSKYSEDNKFSIIFVDENPSEGNIIASSNRAELEREMREAGKCTFAAVTNTNYNLAMEQVNAVLSQNKNADVTIYTDHHINITGEINLVDVSEGEWNVALLSPVIEISEKTGYYRFDTSIASYNQECNITLELSIKNPYSNKNLSKNGNTYIETKNIHLKRNEKQTIEFKDLEIYRFDEASFVIKENDRAIDPIKDRFEEDNSFYAFNGRENKFNVQLISPTRQIFTAAIAAVGGCNDIIYGKDLSFAASSGYDLYIYDSVDTRSLPNDGAIWIANPNPNSGIFGNTIRTSSVVSQHSNVIVNETFTNPDYAEIVKNFKVFDGLPLFVNRYTKIESYDNTMFEPLVLAEDGSPLVLVGQVGLTRACIFAFDFKYSNFGTSIYMPILSNNIFKYSVNRIVSSQFYTVGSTVEIHPKATTTKVEILHNGLTSTFGEDALRSGVKYKLNTAGVYTVVTYEGTRSTNYSFHARIADSESNFGIKYRIQLLEKVGNDGISQKVSRENKDISIYFAIALLALLVIEWGVQYREQY